MLTDEELVALMAGGDQAAFETFVHRYHAPLLGYLERMLYDPKKAEDFVQDVFLRLIRQLQSGKPPIQVRPWLYRVALNLCRDLWKKAENRAGQQLMAEPPELKDTRPSVVDIYERQETRKELLQSLEELQPVQREIILLRFYQDLKLNEIAATMDIPLSSIKTHLYNGLRKLKQSLGDKRQAVQRMGKQTKEKEGCRYAHSDR